MDNKDINAVYHLMQNVSDKLGDISIKIENKDVTEIQSIIKKQKTAISYLEHLANGLEKLGSPQQNTINNDYEYVLFGKGSKMDNPLLYVLASLILVAWLSFKYITPVILHQNNLEIEHANYQVFYEYLHLKEMRDEPTKYTIEQMHKHIRAKDAVFFKEYNHMITEDKKVRRRIELESELKKLK